MTLPDLPSARSAATMLGTIAAAGRPWHPFPRRAVRFRIGGAVDCAVPPAGDQREK